MISKRLLSRIVLPAILFLFTETVLAQKVITGKITDSRDHSAIAGASIQPKGGTGGTTTGNDGSFRLSVPETIKTLVISFVGYGSQEFDISNKTTLDVEMTPTAALNLNEVVVVGYGTARKKDVTGAVTSVKAKDFNQGIVTAPDQLLQNKVPGLEITNNSGQPGATTTIKVRGNNSIRAANNPLYVVDGVPLDGRSARPSVSVPSFNTTPDINPLLYINPNDIAQIDILKDASSAAIYGSRGANGVIVITTKSGSSGVSKLDVGTSFGFATGYMKKFEVLDASEFRNAIKKYGVNASLDGGASVDAMDAITQGSLSQNYSLAFSGGNENGKFRASFLGSDQKGFLKNSGIKKYLGSIAGGYKFLDQRLSIDFHLMGGHVGEDIPNVSNNPGSQGNLISAALSWNPTMPFYNSTGGFVFPTNGSGNPLSLLKGVTDEARTNTVLGNISAAVKILNNLEYKFLFAINNSTGERNTNIYGWLQGYTGISGVGWGGKSFASLSSQTFTHTLNYRANLTENLSLDAIGGFEYWKSNFSNSTYSASGFNTNLDQTNTVDIPYTSMLRNGNTQNPPATNVNPTSELQSFFARAIFNFKDKYYLTGTIRRDGSSKFGANNKYGNFPSVAGRWVVTNEDFMKSSSLFSNIALRGSWGITGNQEFPEGASQEQFSFTAYNTASQINVANPDLKWEETSSWNFGLDFALMQGRFFGSFDVYNKNTTDILFQSTAIQPAPSSIYFVNIPGHLINKGIEFALGAALVNNREFGWDLSFNIAHNTNNLESFFAPGTETPLQILTGQINGQGVSGTLAQIITNDKPVNEYWLKPFSGFDAAGNQIVGGQEQFAGDPNPHLLYGISTTLRYQKFTLTINGGGAGGFLIYNNTATNITNVAGIVSGRNIDRAAYNSNEKTASGVAVSNRFLEEGDYFKLRNATINYSVGSLGKYMKGFNIFVSGTNLFVLTKFTGFDPEVNIDKSSNGYPSRSIEFIPYPTPRTISFGLNFSL